MAITLVELRDEVRIRLEDVGGNTLWSDAEITAGIRQSLDRYSWQFPRQLRADLAVQAGDTVVALPEEAVQVKRVADPRGTVIPPRGLPLRGIAGEELAWEQWAGELEFTRPLAAGSYRVWYSAPVRLPASESDPMPVSDHDATLLALGATTFCLEQRAVAEWKRGPLPARYEIVLRRARSEYDAAWRARLRLLRTGRLAATS